MLVELEEAKASSLLKAHKYDEEGRIGSRVGCKRRKSCPGAPRISCLHVQG